MDFDAYLERISERNVGRYDVTALFERFETFERVVDDLADPFRDREVDAVAGLDALGFALGSGVALELAVGFLPVRKGGKLPLPEADLLRREVTDYSDERKTLVFDERRVEDGTRILLVDDWIDTGSQMDAATELVEAAGGTVVVITVLDATGTELSVALGDEYDLHAVNPETTL